MDIRRITEVGVAVRNLDQATQLFVDLFNADCGEVIEVRQYSMRFRMCRIGKVDFELMEPTSDTGVIADFLAKRGEGLHHVAFAVDDIDDTMATLGRKQVQFVDGTPTVQSLDVVDYAGRSFSEDIRFTFSHPASILGILFEFIEYPKGYATP
ncbi:MAG: methylmalonyl-CoA/ethylmalonyl-CoA epimerase [Gammaproteobacteria bacterium]|jgi:methylmalonyl-CoA/ethylmalonyl-CoA epimerase